MTKRVQISPAGWCRLVVLIAIGVFTAMAGNAVSADILGGPSSVREQLIPRDAVRDPDYRSGFPRNVIPKYFEWKDRLKSRGFQFNIEYLSLGQALNTSDEPDQAAGGLARLYGTWQATPNGSLTFKIENRHKYTAVSPQDLGNAAGALSVTGTVFSDAGSLLTNLFWSQTALNNRWAVRAGIIDVTDFLDGYGLISPYTAFQNAAFSTNPTIATPGQGFGVAGAVTIGSKFLAYGTIADANADPSNPNLDVFVDGDLFKSLDLVLTNDLERAFDNNAHISIWHSDAAADNSREEDYGATFSISGILDNRWVPFLRAGRSKGTAALYNRLVATGVGYRGPRGDLSAIGLSWGGARDVDGTEFAAELFHRFSISPGLELTPSIQYIRNPLINQRRDNLAVFSLRGRIVF